MEVEDHQSSYHNHLPSAAGNQVAEEEAATYLPSDACPSSFLGKVVVAGASSSFVVVEVAVVEGVLRTRIQGKVAAVDVAVVEGVASFAVAFAFVAASAAVA